MSTKVNYFTGTVLECSTCKFYDKTLHQTPYDGSCRIKAPILTDEGLQASWPIVDEDDWCGEYKQAGVNDVWRI